MDSAELHLQEYNRALGILDKYEQNTDRLTLLRTVFLLVAVLFLGAYTTQYDEIRSLRDTVVLDAGEEESTVLGYITVHQEVKDLVSKPDKRADALIRLIPKLASFLGQQELTLENRSQYPVRDILGMASMGPEQIRIENPYLPKLAIPISYSALSVSCAWIALASFFYFSYRRVRLRLLIGYIRYHLEQLHQLLGEHDRIRPLARPQLVGRGLAGALGLGRPPSRWGLGKPLQAMLVASGRSPFRFLNWMMTAALFLRLVMVTSRIVFLERGINPLWYWKAAFLLMLVVIPSLLLDRLNKYFSAQYSDEERSFLRGGEEW